MSNRREKGRALFLTFLMVMSVVGMGVAFGGAVAAQQQTSPSDEVFVDDYAQTNNTYFNSIQEALNNTGDGTLITVREGTYNESLNISSSNVSIQGAGIGQSVIQGSSSNPNTAVLLGANVGGNNPGAVTVENVSISGFTINQNISQRGAIRTTGSAPSAHANLTIENNRFVANGSNSGVSYSAYIQNAQDVRIAGNEFAVEGSGAEEHLATSSDSEGFVVEGNTFEGDLARLGQTSGGNAVEVRGSDFTIQSNDFSAVSTDGAIVADINDDLDLATVLSSNTFDQTVTVENSSGTLRSGIYGQIQPAVDAASEDNTVNVGPGTYDESVVVPEGLTLKGPNAGISGDSDSRVQEATVTGRLDVNENSTIDGFELIEGSTISVVYINPNNPGPEPVELQNNVINSSSPGDTVGIEQTNANDLIVENNLIVDNYHGILIADPGNATIRDNVISSNDYQGVKVAGSQSADNNIPFVFS